MSLGGAPRMHSKSTRRGASEAENVSTSSPKESAGSVSLVAVLGVTLDVTVLGVTLGELPPEEKSSDMTSLGASREKEMREGDGKRFISPPLLVRYINSLRDSGRNRPARA
jgi:hypothetical protein